MKKVVVVTGASSGLGLSLAKKFAASGHLVYGISRTQTKWENAVNAVGYPDSFKLLQADLTKEQQVKKSIESILKQAGQIDLIINNAGYGGTLSKTEDLSLKEFQNHIESNLYSVFLMCKYSIPILRKQKHALIINISSMAGKRAVPRLSAYSASKFGVVALSQSVAKENTDTNLRCITVCPGGMNTEMRSSLFGKEDADRQQTPDFVADVIYKIVTDEIRVDSGGDVVIRHSQVTVNPVPAA